MSGSARLVTSDGRTPAAPGIGLLRAASWAIAALPAGAGRGFLARHAAQRWLSRHDYGERAARLRGGARLKLDLADPAEAHTFFTREYEPPLLRFIESRLAAGGTFLDVGAHVGLVSIPVAAAARRAEVHAFEPDPSNAAFFRSNLELNPGLRVQLNETAVGPESGTAVLERSVPGGDRALGRVVADGEASGAGSVEVPMTCLDEYLESAGIETVDVIKIDVEGFEPAVLKGAQRALSEHRLGCVICEMNESLLEPNGWSGGTIRDALAQHGYDSTAIPELGLRRIFPRKHLTVEDEAFVPSAQREAAASR